MTNLWYKTFTLNSALLSAFFNNCKTNSALFFGHLPWVTPQALAWKRTSYNVTRLIYDKTNKLQQTNTVFWSTDTATDSIQDLFSSKLLKTKSARQSRILNNTPIKSVGYREWLFKKLLVSYSFLEIVSDDSISPLRKDRPNLPVLFCLQRRWNEWKVQLPSLQ